MKPQRITAGGWLIWSLLLAYFIALGIYAGSNQPSHGVKPGLTVTTGGWEAERYQDASGHPYCSYPDDGLRPCIEAQSGVVRWSPQPEEDEAGWDCSVDGNGICGPGVIPYIIDGEGERHATCVADPEWVVCSDGWAIPNSYPDGSPITLTP